MFGLKPWPQFAASVFAATLIASPIQASAESGWQSGGAIYLWGAGIGATTLAGDDLDLSFSDLVDNLDFAFMAAFEARKDRWGGLADFVYLNVSFEDSTTGNIIDRPVKLNVDVDMKSWIISGAATYAIHETDRTQLDLLGGARYLYLDTGLEFQVGEFRRKASESDSVIDAIVGLRGRTDLSDKWYLNYSADIGAGQSDLTWQALAGFNYRFDKVDAGFGYRYLKWEFDDYLLADMEVSGPYAGVRFRF
jgi:hypothetical protein